MYEAVQTLLAHLARGPILPFPSITFPIYLRLSPAWQKSRELLHSFIVGRIAAARERAKLVSELEDGTDCVLDMLVQQEQHEGPETSKAMQESEWFDEILVFFLTGQTPPATVLTWFVKYIATDMDIQRRLRAEVCAAFGTSPVTLETVEDSDKMPVLQAVVAETLRCSMTAGVIVRQLLVDEIIMGSRAPKGTELLVPTGLFGV
ncbi:hypothetical protein FS749_012032 [Ceratobasidium sp. UAMH 11750]|nr:hypothetical protein FS749_012032 [Ceratobasidium sp. UAMH 11750]